MDLPNYNNHAALEISKSGYLGIPGAEWICESGCKTSGQTFSQNSTAVTPNNICTSTNGDCTVVLKVNWGQCTDTNASACSWITACRSGTTTIYQSVAQALADDYGGVVYHYSPYDVSHSTKLYYRGTVTSGGYTLYKVKILDISPNSSPSTPTIARIQDDNRTTNDIYYIFANCVGDYNQVCQSDVCPG